MTTDKQHYIESHKALFWYTPEDRKKDISDALLVETILNYGTMDDCRQLFDVMGIDADDDVFFSAEGRQKDNYFPEIRNFFTLIFNRYAHRNS